MGACLQHARFVALSPQQRQKAVERKIQEVLPIIRVQIKTAIANKTRAKDSEAACRNKLVQLMKLATTTQEDVEIMAQRCILHQEKKQAFERIVSQLQGIESAVREWASNINMGTVMMKALMGTQKELNNEPNAQGLTDIIGALETAMVNTKVLPRSSAGGSASTSEREHGHGRGHERGHGHGHGRGHGHFHGEKDSVEIAMSVRATRDGGTGAVEATTEDCDREGLCPGASSRSHGRGHGHGHGRDHGREYFDDEKDKDKHGSKQSRRHGRKSMPKHWVQLEPSTPIRGRKAPKGYAPHHDDVIESDTEQDVALVSVSASESASTSAAKVDDRYKDDPKAMAALELCRQVYRDVCSQGADVPLVVRSAFGSS